jgi:hypothetical protein
MTLARRFNAGRRSRVGFVLSRRDDLSHIFRHRYATRWSNGVFSPALKRRAKLKLPLRGTDTCSEVAIDYIASVSTIYGKQLERHFTSDESRV